MLKKLCAGHRWDVLKTAKKRLNLIELLRGLRLHYQRELYFNGNFDAVLKRAFPKHFYSVNIPKRWTAPSVMSLTSVALLLSSICLSHAPDLQILTCDQHPQESSPCLSLTTETIHYFLLVF
jgi:hypothetical protein